MNLVTMEVTGMRCGMCEAHICDTIRKAVPDAAKVKANRGKNSAQFVTASALDEAKLKAAIDETGYGCGEISVKPYVKKGLFHIFPTFMSY